MKYFYLRRLIIDNHTWIGARRTNTSGWHWVDGTVATDEDMFWYPGEPNNYLGKQNCASIITGTWRADDFWCSNARPGLCETAVLPTCP